MNSPTTKFCCKCGAALDLVAAMDMDKERASLTMEIMELVSQHPGVMDAIKKQMNPGDQQAAQMVQKTSPLRTGNR